MDFCVSCKLAYFTLLIGVLGSVNILRGICYKSRDARILAKPLVICLVRNGVVWCVLQTVKDTFPVKLSKNVKIEIFITALYVIGNRLICEARKERFSGSDWIVSTVLSMGMCAFIYLLTGLVDHHSVLHNMAYISPVAIVVVIAYSNSIGDIESEEFMKKKKSVLTDGPLKDEIVEALNRVYFRQYAVQYMDLMETRKSLLRIVELSLSVYVVLDEQFMKKTSTLEITYCAVHHVIEHYLGFRDTVEILNTGSYIVLFIAYGFVVLGYASDLSVCLRLIVCYEIHEIAMQIKAVIMGYLSGYIEKKITKKIGKASPFTLPINSEDFSGLMHRCNKYAINRKLYTDYEQTFYKYYPNERIQDINVKPGCIDL